MSLYLILIFFIWLTYLILISRAIYKKNTIVLCLLIASILLAGYLINMEQAGQTVYGGLVGDNSFQVALLNNVIHGNYFGDYYQKSSPLDYPPLFFWFLGTIARWLHLDAIKAWRLFPLLLLPLLPLLFYKMGEILGGKEVALWTCLGALGIGAITTNTGFFGVTRVYATWGIVALALGKPYEMLSAFLLLYWLLDVRLREFSTGKLYFLKNFAFGGMIALMYYPFLLPGLLALILEYGKEKSWTKRENILKTAFSFFLGVFLLSAPFWGVVLYSFLNLPHGPNYRTHYIALWHFDPVGYTLGLGYGGGLFLFGLLAIWRLWKQGIKSPGYLLLSVYGLVGINFLTYPLFGLSWLPAKWMEFLLVFFAGLAGKGLKEFVDEKLYFRRNFFMLVLSASLLPTPLIWNIFTDFNFLPNKPLISVSYQIVKETGKVLDNESPVVLATPPVAFVLPAISQWSLYLAPNIHYAGVFSNYQSNLRKVLSLEQLDGAKIEKSLREMGIQVLVLQKQDSAYRLYFHTRSRPVALWTSELWPYPYESISLLPSVFSSPAFIKTFENEEYVVFVVRSASY
jgi:hypothetical protein